jgi:outer membrane protein assembly factor BamB
MNRFSTIALFCCLLFSSTAIAENWGHWRGPSGNGTTTGNPPIVFGPNKNVKWQVEIPGASSGSPVVWGDRVFAVTSIPKGGALSFHVLCYDRTSGKLLWDRTAVEATPHQETHNTNTHASASPCTDGQHVYAHFGSRGLFCYTMDGQPKWNHDFGDMQTRNSFGEGSSPTLAGNMIIVPWDHEAGSALFALDKVKGEVLWKTPRDEPTCWATPFVFDHQGKKQIVMNGQNYTRSYDLQTGKELWRCGGQTERPCASPVGVDDLVIVGSGHRGSFLGAFKLSGNGDIKGTSNVAWTINHDTPDVASPLLVGNRLYFYKAKSGQLSCVDVKTGKPHYTAVRVNGVNTTYASPVSAGGKIYLTDRSGKIVVIEDSVTFKALATNDLGEGVDATPAIVDNQMFIRSAKHLYCIEEK